MPAILTVDAVLLTLLDSELHVALHKRETEPCKGHWALPGGYVHEDEDSSAKDAAARVLLEKTAIKSPYLEEFGTFSGPLRDPRGWSLTVVYFALVAEPMASNLVELFPVNKLPALCFDHHKIVDSVVERVRNKAGYSSLPVHLVAKEFTISELHAAYESVLGERLGMSSFRRRLDGMGILEEVPGATRLLGRNRPAQLYRVALRYRNKLSLRDRVL